MTAMADLGDAPVARSAIAAAMKITSNELSVPRARLIDKGFIAPAGRGTLEFTVPGFAHFVREQHSAD